MRLEVRVLLLVLVLGLLTGLPGAEGRHGAGGGRKDHHHHGEHHGGGGAGGGGGGGHHRIHRAGRARRAGGQPTDAVITDTNTQEETTATTPEEQISCESDDQCVSFKGSICNATIKVCECPPALDIIKPNKFCTKRALLNATCEYNEECKASDKNAICVKRLCVCSEDFELRAFQSNVLKCATQGAQSGPKMEPAMIGVLAGLALMFVIICVVLRLFSKARFRENRSIFNTPNPRLMNASLFKDSKLLSPARGDRRGSRASVRAPSRAASLTSVTRDPSALPRRSPTGSLASKGRRGSSVSATSNAAAGSTNANAPSAPGSATSATAPAPAAATATATKSPSPSKDAKDNNETTVAIETVD